MGTQRLAAPDVRQLRAWLSPIVGAASAAELADAVDADPPHASGWKRPPGGSD